VPDDKTDQNSKNGSSDGDREGKEEAQKRPKLSHIIEEHTDVGVSPQVAYDQWMRFEDYGSIFKKESAERRNERRIRFNSKIGPSKRTWDAEVVEQRPRHRVAWRSKSGPQNRGVLSFHRLVDENLTRVMVEMEHEPSGFMETIGTFLRMPRRRVRKNLRLFKNYVELRGEAPSADGADARIGSRTSLQDEGDQDSADEKDSGEKTGSAAKTGGRS